MKPLIRRSAMTNRYWLLTRYKIDGDSVIASTKTDITDEVESLLAEAGLDAPAATHPSEDLAAAWLLLHRLAPGTVVAGDHEFVAFDRGEWDQFLADMRAALSGASAEATDREGEQG